LGEKPQNWPPVKFTQACCLQRVLKAHFTPKILANLGRGLPPVPPIEDLYKRGANFLKPRGDSQKGPR